MWRFGLLIMTEDALCAYSSSLLYWLFLLVNVFCVFSFLPVCWLRVVVSCSTAPCPAQDCKTPACNSDGSCTYTQASEFTTCSSGYCTSTGSCGMLCMYIFLSIQCMLLFFLIVCLLFVYCFAAHSFIHSSCVYIHIFVWFCFCS